MKEEYKSLICLLKLHIYIYACMCVCVCVCVCVYEFRAVVGLFNKRYIKLQKKMVVVVNDNKGKNEE